MTAIELYRAIAAAAAAAALVGGPGVCTAAAICAPASPSISTLSYVYTAATPFEVQVSVTCSGFTSGETVSPTLAVDAGVSGNAASRHMTSPGGTLAYNLYTTSGYSAVVGDGANGGVTVAMPSASSTQTTSSVTLFGEIPAGQGSAPAGAGYSDTLGLTISY